MALIDGNISTGASKPSVRPVPIAFRYSPLSPGRQPRNEALNIDKAPGRSGSSGYGSNNSNQHNSPPTTEVELMCFCY